VYNISVGFRSLVNGGQQTIRVEQAEPGKEIYLWPKKDVGANVGGSGRLKRHKGSAGNA
jgi:hypothetical protein